MNQLQIIGNLGRDAEEPKQANGKTVVNFSVAVNTKRGGNEDTQWVRCAMWGDRAEKVRQYLTKGTKVFIQGPVSIETYDKDGKTKHNLKVMVNELQLLGGGEKRSGGNDSDDPFGNG